MMRLPTKKRLRKEKPEKPEFSRLFGLGADVSKEKTIKYRFFKAKSTECESAEP